MRDTERLVPADGGRSVPDVVLLLALPAPAAAEPAAAPQLAPSANLARTITLTTDIHPRLTTQARHEAVTTHGLTGTAICTGTVNGQPVTGPGRFGNTLQGVNNCTQGSFTGTFVLKIPTAAGEQTITGRFAETVVAPLTAAFTGDLTGTVVSAILREGDCVTTPLPRQSGDRRHRHDLSTDPAYGQPRNRATPRPPP